MKWLVLVTSPAGTTSRVVECDNLDECMQVVEGEGKKRPRGTLLNIIRRRPTGDEPKARWAVTSKGLVRGKPYPKR